MQGSQRLNFAFVANLFNNAKCVLFAPFLPTHTNTRCRHAKPVERSPAAASDSNREAELLAIIERLQRENEALKRENERLKEGEIEGSKLKRVRNTPTKTQKKK